MTTLGKFKYKTGKRFGKITVLFHGDDQICDCFCDCGNIFRKKASALTPSGAKSCGCTNGFNKKYPKEITNHKLYEIWKNITRKRGKNPGFLESWSDYRVFYKWAIDKWKPNLRCYSKNFNEIHGPNNTIFVLPSEISKESQNRIDVKNKLSGRKRKYSKEICNHNLYTIWCKKIKKQGVCKDWQDYKAFYNWAINKYYKTCCFVKIDKNIDFGPNNTKIINKSESSKISCINKKTFSCSKEEKTVADFLNSINVLFRKDRKILEGKELDFLTDINIAIEYSGIFWHSDIYVDKNYHYEKYQKCLNKNIQLINIFSDEWINRRQQCENHLRSIFNKNNKIYARNCKFKKISQDIALEFIDNNHIQQLKKKPKYCFGLYYKDILYSVMTFDYHPRDINKLSLNRFCSLDNFTIVGGASKLFKNALKYLPNQDIYSWSDNRYSNGNIYKVLGFSLIKELKPDYSYIQKNNPKERFSKQSMKKGNINCPNEITEREYTKQLGYYRIYDAGKKTWLYKV